MNRSVTLILRAFFLLIISTPRPSALTDQGSCPKSIWPVGDKNRCTELMSLDKLGVRSDLGVIPGSGWDNIVNEVSGQVYALTYAICKMMDDGRLLVPDNVYTVPMKITNKESIAEVFSKWQDVTSSTSQTINVAGGLAMKEASVSGSFSKEKSEIRAKQINEDGYIVRSQIRLHRYTVWLQPDSTFTPEFKTRLERIAANVLLNNTNMALYDAELLVKDFGTHAITKVYAGAVLVKTDIVRRDYILSQKGDSNKWKLGAAGGATLKKKLRIDFRFEYSEGSSKENIDTYEKNLISNITEALGGNQNLTRQSETLVVSEWLKGVDRNLVAIDRVGEPLHLLLATKALPNIPATVIGQTAEVVRMAIERYYEANAIFGCTDIKAPNFDPAANVDDGNCSQNLIGLPFGGVFQTCTPPSVADVRELESKCHSALNFLAKSECSEEKIEEKRKTTNPCYQSTVVNMATNDYSCPLAFTPVKILQGTLTKRFMRKVCEPCNVVAGKFGAYECCKDQPVVNEGTYVRYWCKPNPSANTQVYFGGLFTSKKANPATGKQTCPYSFIATSFNNDTTICLSTDAEFSKNVAFPFGGFVSCELRSNTRTGKNKTCPGDFVEIDFQEVCVYSLCGPKSKSYTPLSVRKPPFLQRPADTGASDYMWARADNYEPAVMTPYEIAGLSVLSVLVTILIFLVMAKAVDKIERRCRWMKKRTQMSRKDRTSESDSV